MTASELLVELERRGIHTEVAGDKLRFRPKDAVTPELIEVLRQHKAKIIQVLQPAVAARIIGQGRVLRSATPETCWHCHGEKVCRCALCAVRGPALIWGKGQCGACIGTGFLTWPERVQ